VLPVARLTDVFRQQSASTIISNAHRINHGELPELVPAGQGLSDFYFVEARGTADAVRKIVRIVQERIPHRFSLDPVKDVQVLCPMNRGGLGARSLNVELQQALNPPRGRRIERFGWTFGVGDKVMQVENDYDRNVFNGELGMVSQVDEPKERVVVTFDGREIVYEAGDLDQITLAYATTIHKAQGSEYPAVVIPLTTQHRTMLHRSLIYTGITRARRLVVLVGEPEALRIAVATVQDRRRWSKLKDWLRVA
jgi:exodeoxyribonuclease V alpha subunit